MKYILILFIATLIGCGKSDFQSEINTVNDLISEYDSLFVVVKSFAVFWCRSFFGNLCNVFVTVHTDVDRRDSRMFAMLGGRVAILTIDFVVSCVNFM